MSEPLNEPSATSVLNSLANMGVDVSGAEPLTSVDTFRIASTGAQAKTDFLYQPYNEAWPEARKLEWEKFNMLEIGTTPAKMATDMTETLKAERNAAAEAMKAQREREAQAQDPANQADLAGKKADAAAKQGEIQQSYLQELQYQRHISTLNNPKATRAERATAINAIDGLAASIGQRMIKGTSTAAVADAKRLVGTVSSRVPLVPFNLREYSPLDLGAKVLGYDGTPDYSAQLETMLGGSQERMGVLRQQMEAAGIPLPEAKQMEEAVKNPPPADKFQLSVQRFGVKGADGAQVMLNGAPVVRRKDGALFKAMPSGKGVELTAEEISQLGL
jgi:hypothetical protein